MGSNKSKPVVETARSVLNRRQMEITQAVAQPKNVGTEGFKALQTQRVDDQSEYELEADVISKISKLAVVKESKIPVTKKPNVIVASIIRYEEQVKMDLAKKASSSIEFHGRLSEAQFAEIMMKFRYDGVRYH
jgi:hypothetical protein